MSLIGKKNSSVSIAAYDLANIVSDDSSFESFDSMIVLLLCSIIKQPASTEPCLRFALMSKAQQHKSYMIHQKLNTT